MIVPLPVLLLVRGITLMLPLPKLPRTRAKY